MKKRRILGGVCLLAVGTAGVGIALASVHRGGGDEAPPPVPAVAADRGVELLFAQPFLLDEEYTHWWRAERPKVDAGYVLVLGVDPDLVFPRQGYEPVLYVGAQTAERLNVGFAPETIAPGGRANVVVFAPAVRDGEGGVALDLGRTPLWFGTPALPEEVDEGRIRREYELALQRGVRPPSAQAITAALHEGGGTLYLPDYHSLRQYAAELIRRYSPGERDLVESMLAPPPERARFVR